MKFQTVIAVSTAAVAMAWATASFAGTFVAVGAPAPLLGAGLPGLAILAVAGGGYVAMRLRRRGRD